MEQRVIPDGVNPDFFQVDSNQGLVLKLFRSYYRAHQSSGGMIDHSPGFFLVKPAVLKVPDLVERASDKFILEDCIRRAEERQGHVGVCKHRNEKLKYYWLELTVMPYMLGDPVSDENKHEFFFVLSQFVEYTRQHPKVYGDVTAEIDSDKDLALMLKEINRLAEGMKPKLSVYSQDMLVRFNPRWPIGEVNKLMMAMKDNNQSWCEVFFEYLIYVMSKKRQ